MNKIRMIVEGDAYEKFSEFLELGLKANELGFKFKVCREGEEAIVKPSARRTGPVDNLTASIFKEKGWTEVSYGMFLKTFEDKDGSKHTYKLPFMDAYARQFVEDQK